MALALLLQILAAVSFSKRTVRITPAAHKSQPDRYCSSFANYSVILPTAGARTDTSTFCLDSDNLLDTASTTLFCRVSGVPSKMDSGIWGTASVIARHAESKEEGDGDGVRNGGGNGASITTRERAAKSRTRAKMVRIKGWGGGRPTRATERARATRTTAETSMTARRRGGRRASVFTSSSSASAR